ncbi:MAG: hypothetical protein NTY06_03480 [Candidatus Gottesmanbacteria bacterium]|nr:hypothetical protein [Candidatus Gottesmanbacteria bacterium]
MSKEDLTQIGDTLEIGRERYKFTQETQQFLIRSFTSTYPKDTSIVIVNEPHESSEGQYNLYKGLQLFFASNPDLVKYTIFLSEGTPANQPISIRELIDEEAHPSDKIIRQVLQSFMITGYMAYEWQSQHGIPIVGTEDTDLYELSRRFASLCRENPNAVFQHRKPIDGDEYDIPLMFAWNFAIAARNKRIAQTLIEKVGKYKNPVLFVAIDHVRDRRHKFQKEWDKIINRNLVDAQSLSVMGAMQFPWSTAGEDWFLYSRVKKDTDTYDIHHYLQEAKIGYTYLSSKGAEKASPEDEKTYNRIFSAQREKRVK